MAILKPSPSSPMRSASSTSRSFMKMEPTSPARIPSRSSMGSVRRPLPAIARSTMKAETPFEPPLGSVLANRSM